MKMLKDSLLVGLALFAMFFGAGNVIFPPMIGLSAGSAWPLGLICYYIADVGLGLLAILAMLRSQNIERPEGIMFRLGAIPGRLMMAVVILCIGPLLAMPRTCAAAFEMGIVPLFGDKGLAVFSVIYFALVVAFSIRETVLVELVGRYLTPLLVLGLVALIVAGIINPLGPTDVAPKVDNLVWFSISSGYQTLDVLATLIYGLIIVNALKAKGYTDDKSKFLSVSLAGIVAGTLLFVVYGGLCYLGATATTLYSTDTNLAQLLLGITRQLFGPVGGAILGLTVALACITTAVALAGSTALFFMSVSGGRLKYPWVVCSVCGFSALVANVGLSAIIAFAVPILTIVYPAALVVVMLSLFNPEIKNDNVFKFATLAALAVSTADVFAPDAVRFLPLSAYGFGWLVPSAVAAVVGACVRPGKRHSRAF